MTYSDTIADRLQARLVRRDNGCVEWTGARTACGYGRISRGRSVDGYERTHRVVWELANGPIPPGMAVCHHCDNPPCCALGHLFLGSQGDNVHDMWAKGRQGGTIPSGEAHPDARLTDEQVADLRHLAPELNNYAALGRLFGISKQHARDLALGHKRAS